MSRPMLILFIAIVAGSLGHVALSKGMKQVETASGSYVSSFGNLWVISGIALQALFFFLYMGVLRKFDLSYALPLTALTYVIVAFLSRGFLGETLTLWRWAGTLLICLGVALISLKPG